MILVRAAWLFVIPAALAVVPPVSASALESKSAITRRVYFTPATPLEEIPLYSLDPAAPGAGAVNGLEKEIDRLYRHATTLPSGHDRRSFETRIYLLEKQLRPLLAEFNADAWTKLREAVKSEWIAVQATLPAASLPAVKNISKEATGEPLALAH